MPKRPRREPTDLVQLASLQRKLEALKVQIDMRGRPANGDQA
jgi:hypothetical protein